MRSNRTLVLAFDHIFLGLLPGIERTEHIIAELLPEHPDGIIMNLGVLRRLKSDIRDAGITPILRLDGNRTYLAGDWTKSPEWELFYTADCAVNAGAKAAIVNLLVGGPSELSSIKVVVGAVAACQEAGIPLLVSAIALESGRTSRGGLTRDTHNGASFAARLAYELGADMVNVYNATDIHLMREALSVCPAPTLMSGGSWLREGHDVVAWARSAIREGAAGVCIGRAVWQYPEPGKITRDLRSTIDALTASDPDGVEP